MPDTPLNYATLPPLFRDYDASTRTLAFRARTREEWADWREVLSAKLVELIGGFPAERSPLRPATLEVREEPDYRLEKVAFQSEPGLRLRSPGQRRVRWPIAVQRTQAFEWLR